MAPENDQVAKHDPKLDEVVKAKQRIGEGPTQAGAMKASRKRELIRARTGEGRERAKAQGVKMVRKPKLIPPRGRLETPAVPGDPSSWPLRLIGAKRR